MNNLIPINSERQTTSARDLWNFLDRPYEQFNKWFDKYKNYGFIENEDFEALSTKILTAQGNLVNAKDYEITVDMAKELAMLQKTEKGSQARRYFIAVEKAWNSPEMTMKRALEFANKKVIELQSKIQVNKPKVIFADAVSTSKTSILVGELAKILRQNGYDIGQNRLFAWLRNNGYLISRKGTDYNMPTQRSMELELFEIKETSIAHSDGHTSTEKTPKVTGKGQIYFINKFKQQYVA